MRLEGLPKLLLRCVLFAAPVVAGLAYLDHQLPSSGPEFELKYRPMRRAGPVAKIIVVGSSYTLNGIDPAEFPCLAINLSMTGQTIDIESLLVRKYLPDWKMARVLIVSASYYDLGGDRTIGNPAVRWRAEEYKRIFDLPVPLDGIRWQRLIEDSKLARFTPRGAISIVREGRAPPLSDPGWLGWSPLATLSDGGPRPSEIRSRADLRLMSMSEERRERNVSDLDALLRVAGEGRVQTVLIVTPLPDGFRRALPASEFTALHNALARAASEHGAIVADYSGDPRFVPSDFADGDHLSEAGARRLSRILADEVLVKLGACEGLANTGVPQAASPLDSFTRHLR